MQKQKIRIRLNKTLLTLPVTDASGGLDLRREIVRKAFHFLASIIPVAYFFLTTTQMAVFLISGLGASLVIDVGRQYWPWLNQQFNEMFGRWLRTEESMQLTGATWFLSGSLMTFLLVPNRDIVIAALFFLAIGDLMAAIIGKAWGRFRLFDKTLEGTLACFISSFGISILLVDWPIGLGGAITSAVVELLPLPLNDNLLIPTCSALVMWTMTLYVPALSASFLASSALSIFFTCAW